MKQGYKVALLVLVVLLIDQALKFYIKTNFELNQDVKMFGLDWARLHFVENRGMAFGIEFNMSHGDFDYGKLLLSSFRIIMVIGLIWYTRMLMQAKAPMGFVYCVGLITAGALGNIIDSTFYALIFSGGYHDEGVAQLMPFGQGYGLTENLPMNGFLHGRVVDMFYFPMTTIQLPEWLGGGSYLFFSPIFNVADAAITTGITCILLFQRRFFRDGFMEDQKTTEETAVTEVVPEETEQEEIVPDPETPATPESPAVAGVSDHPQDNQNNQEDISSGQPAESKPEH
ncbi:MAG: lipoprotein signal peptidase [Lewinellaceae bacterium]|nr:lipoprotein signal peptidase [Lewinellaceae bacterium]